MGLCVVCGCVVDLCCDGVFYVCVGFLFDFGWCLGVYL